MPFLATCTASHFERPPQAQLSVQSARHTGQFSFQPESTLCSAHAVKHVVCTARPQEEVHHVSAEAGNVDSGSPS
jgi:hypothetical protein